MKIINNSSRLYALDAKQIREIEEEVTKDKENSLKIMQRAAIAVFQEVKKAIKKSKVLVICGPGNNAGDGYALAQLLLQNKWAVEVLPLINPVTYECQYYAQQYQGAVVAKNSIKSTLEKTDLIIDGVWVNK